MKAQPLTSSRRTLTFVLYLTAGALLWSLLQSRRLWLDHPYFGSMPTLDGLPRLGSPIDLAWYAALVLLLLPAAIVGERRRRWWIFGWCAVCLSRCIWDRMAWQPYIYQFFFIMLVVAWASPKLDRKRAPAQTDADVSRRADASLNMLRLIVSSVYFWSGISKFNASFPKLMTDLMALFLPAGVFELLHDARFVYAIPVIETLIGVGLLFRYARWVAAAGAILMHVSILWMLVSLDYNHVVWPWNIAMIVLVVVLFRDRRTTTFADILGRGAPHFQRVTLVFCTICPGLSFAGLWYPYLSFRLYSGDQSELIIYLPPSVVQRLPPHTRPSIMLDPERNHAKCLHLPYWAEKELGAFVPSDPWIYRSIAGRLCRAMGSPADITIERRASPDWWTGHIRVEQLTCRDVCGTR